MSLFPDWMQARDAGMTAVAERAEQIRPGFADAAAAFVLDYLRRGAASGEEITDACKAAGIVPHDDRSFGPVYMRLARAGLIRKSGAAVRRKGHGTAGGNVWRLTENG